MDNSIFEQRFQGKNINVHTGYRYLFLLTNTTPEVNIGLLGPVHI